MTLPSLSIHKVILSATLIALASQGPPAEGARGLESGSDPDFWNSHAVIVAQILPGARGDQFNLQVTFVLSATFPVPGTLTVAAPARMPHELTPGSLILLCVGKGENWAVPSNPIDFMPGHAALAELSNDKDARIEKLRDDLRDLQKKNTDTRAGSAADRAAQAARKQFQYNTAFWQTHCLVLAKLTPPAPHQPALAQIDIKSTLYAPAISPALSEPLVLGSLPAALAAHIDQSKGQWAILLLNVNHGNWNIDSSSAAPPFMPDPSGYVELQDDQDPKIPQLEKSVQTWQGQILNASTIAPASK